MNSAIDHQKSLGKSAPRAARAWLLCALVAVVALLAACNAGPSIAPTAAESVASSEAATPTGDTWQGVSVGFTDDGKPWKGDPNAPVTLSVYSDFQCPFCARFFVNTEPGIIDEYIKTGKVLLVFEDLPLKELHPNALAAHEASRCVADQGAPLYWAMYDALFLSQSEWSEQADPQPTFARLADEIGADVDALKECIAGGAKQAAIAQSVVDADALGFSGTPSFRVTNNASGESHNIVGAQPFERFAGVLDAVLAGEAPPTPSAAQPRQEVPFWATAEGLALDPDRPGYTMAGDQTRGSADASVVVVEFSDFQCPYCKQHSEQTQPELDKAFVDTGEVRWVYKSFPLPIHPQAPAAGVAAECAADQGKYMEMHEALFADVRGWSTSDPSPMFTQIAGDLGLDTAAFAACLADPAMAALVEADHTDGLAYVQGTPTFIILANGGGRIVPGALPFASFSAELQKAIDGG